MNYDFIYMKNLLHVRICVLISYYRLIFGSYSLFSRITIHVSSSLAE